MGSPCVGIILTKICLTCRQRSQRWRGICVIRRQLEWKSVRSRQRSVWAGTGLTHLGGGGRRSAEFLPTRSPAVYADDIFLFRFSLSDFQREEKKKKKNGIKKNSELPSCVGL